MERDNPVGCVQIAGAVVSGVLGAYQTDPCVCVCVQVCLAAVGLVCDLCRALMANVLPHCDEIMQLLLENLGVSHAVCVCVCVSLRV